MKPIRYEMKTASCKQEKFYIGLPYSIQYEMKTVSCKRGLTVSSPLDLKYGMVTKQNEICRKLEKLQTYDMFLIKLMTIAGNGMAQNANVMPAMVLLLPNNRFFKKFYFHSI